MGMICLNSKQLTEEEKIDKFFGRGNFSRENQSEKLKEILNWGKKNEEYALKSYEMKNKKRGYKLTQTGF